MAIFIKDNNGAATLVGVVSWVYPGTRPGYPDVYSGLYTFIFLFTNHIIITQIFVLLNYIIEMEIEKKLCCSSGSWGGGHRPFLDPMGLWDRKPVALL